VQSTTQAAPVSKKAFWAGVIISALPALLLCVGGVFTLINPAAGQEQMKHLGYPEHALRGIIIAEIACAVIYMVPQTAVLGAILLTGYLGGATATHVRVGESFFMPISVGIVVWLGLYLRDPRIRALVPFRTAPQS